MDKRTNISSEVKETWIYTFTHTYVLIAYFLVKHIYLHVTVKLHFQICCKW
jgi:hypothetical protein